MNIEVEIKLAIDDTAILQLQQHPLLQRTMTPPSQSQLISTYFDTPTKQLRKAGFALRIRENDGALVQTLKGRAASQAGMTARHEWEWPLQQFAVNVNVLPQPELQKLFANAGFLKHFGPRFVTDFSRKTWDIELSDKTQIEVALDQGKITAGEQTTLLQELELELKAGNPETLKAVANLFQTELKLKPEDRSKAARGFALISI